MTTGLPFVAPPRAIHLPHHRRSDVWLRVWSGVGLGKLEVSAPRDASRRARCERDALEFLLTYFPHRFNHPSAAHIEIVRALESAILSGLLIPVKAAVAAPRSFGKTTIVEGILIWAAAYGHRRFLLFIGAKGPNAESRLASIKHEWLTNSRLAEDFPEIVERLRAMHGGDARRAPADYPWATDRMRLPNGVWAHARGIDSSLAGLNELGVRPDCVCIDDVETVSSIRSPAETEAIEQRIRLEVMRLHDINCPACYFFICTVRARGSIADRFTDGAKEPEWRGRRYKALSKLPQREDLWERYIDLCKAQPVGDDIVLQAPAQAAETLGMNITDLEGLTHGHQAALRFYAANKAEMDQGAELLDARRLPLHVCYHVIAAEGEVVFACEIQNEPPEDRSKKSLELDVEYLLTRRVGDARKIVPEWAEILTASIDVGAHSLHWEVDAWDAAGRTSCLIDQGQQQTGLNTGGEYRMQDDQRVREVMVAAAVKSALESLRDALAVGYSTADGSKHFNLSAVGVDCGGTAETWAWYETILRFCAQAARWLPLKGSAWSRSIADRAMGRNWICEEKNNPGRRYDCNADEYKLRVARAYEAPLRDAAGAVFSGARILHRETPVIYAKHQTAERWVESISTDAPVGKELRVGWNRDGTKPNHWWDTAWMAYALIDIVRSSQREAPVCRRLQSVSPPKVIRRTY